MHAISMLLADTKNTQDREAVEYTLSRIPEHLLALVADHGMRILVLGKNQRYRDVSGVLHRLGDRGVDSWPISPAGLFVVEERTVYLRSTSPMTVSHETSHAIDCALGGGIYLSGFDPRIRLAFESASAFVTPYAASGIDEYFAESARAMLNINDSQSLWPKVSPERLLELDPLMHARMTEIFTPKYQQVQ